MNHIKEKEAQEAEAFNLKNKRDQYVYEIRKQKVDNKIREKRVKLTQAFLTPQNQQANGPNQDQPLEQIEKGNQSFQELTQEFFRGVGQNDITIVFNAIQNMRHKLSRNDSPPLGEFIETGIFPKLVKLLAEEYKEYVDLQFEVIWVITNAVTGTPEQTAKIIDKETIEILMRYLWHTNSQLVDQVFWALGNLSGDSDDIRRILLDLGIVDKIYGFMKSNKRYSENLVKSVSWIISNLALMRQAHDRLYSLLPLVENFLCQSDDEVCSYACWTYSNLTNIQNDKIFDAFMTPKFLKRITELLESPDLDIKRPVIRTVGNILSGKSSQTKKMFEAGCLDKLEALIEHRKPIVRKEVIWAISNILAESQYIIEKVLEGGLFAKLLSTIILDVTPIKVEALICFVNALSIANMDQAESIIRMGLLKILSQVLASHVPEVVLAGLEVLDAVLIHGKKVQDAEGAAGNPILLSLDHEGVIRFIEELQTHQSNEVYAKVTQIIDAHFETQDVDQA